ncbi:exopolysaccharide production protein ExoF [Pseudorhizobium tarimense]|uniref:Exopolysaccharide production protein ExoF n=1 Tax=Pseudorhizobium tarimense TaxID=1079109 RepID=A0ABV2H0S9_9HYPH|nr:polysaccharide biosynthesis/export family protein [Pseudorhizobium tarimense]MCJ8517478.1 polysaccharide biosynthesis/export family protein [Pseudorhizobium tarimense]
MRNKTPASRPKMAAIGLLASALALAAAAPGQAEETAYHLGVMDQVRIRVAEWQPAEGTIRDWSVIGGDYAVGPGGSISLPFIGELPVAGKTTGEVSKEIGQRLQSEFALRTEPSASVEIAKFRPVYLTGDVTTPGEYPYVPGMTVLKAVSLAGGLRRADAGQRFARDFINASGNAAVYGSERGRLLARQARLLAEIEGADDIAMPASLENVPDARALLESEKALMKSRRERYELQLKALADLRDLLQNEVKSLQQKAETQKEQLKLVQRDRERISRLSEQGLATSQRRLSIEERTADVESTLLDIDTASLRAKQDISKANQDEINLRNDWEAQRTKELQDTEAELEKLDLELNTSRQLMSEALAQSAEALKFDATKATIKYVVVREEGDGTKETAVTESTRLKPGDVVKVASEVLMQ